MLTLAALALFAAEPAAAEPVATPVGKEERLDHHGAVGFIGALTGLRKEASVNTENTWRGGIDLGVSYNIGYASNELLAVLRASFSQVLGQVVVDGQLWGGYRGYFGDRWKTFVDLDLALSVGGEKFTAGPKIGVGVQYELSPISGVFAALGAQLGFGFALVFRAELVIGFQLRSFLLE